MVLLVTSASGANGAGYGKLLAFGEDGQLLGSFSEDARIVDPRGLGVDRAMLFLNSGSNRILALDGKGRVVRESGAIAGLNPGGGNFGPDGRYYVGLRAARKRGRQQRASVWSSGCGDNHPRIRSDRWSSRPRPCS
jgi:hypothetical protein